MAYADGEEGYEEHWNVIKTNFNLQFPILKHGTQSGIFGRMHGRIGILIMDPRPNQWQSH
jgi:hypothetical protein